MFLTVSLLGLLGFILCWMVYEEENPVDKVPGPPRKPIIGYALEYMRITSRNFFLKMRQYSEQYGDRYLLKVFKRRVLHTYALKDVEIILSDSKNITKSKLYNFLEPWLGSGVLLSTGPTWHRQRKILTPTFHFNILNNFKVVIDKRSRDLVDKLKEYDGKVVDLMPVISEFTLFTICETAMGTQLHSDKTSSSLEYKNATKKIGDILMSRLFQLWLYNEYIFRMLPIGKMFQKCLRQVNSFADSVIMKRKIEWKPGQSDFTDDVSLNGKKRLAMLDMLLEVENKGEIDLKGIKDEVNTFIYTGHDTTAMAIVFGLMLIADHEEVQELIYEECQKILGDSDRPVSIADLADMKYLEAVIKETLRLYPSVPFIGRRITEDLILDDLPIKKGIEVVVHIYDLHRRADLFSDPTAFKPERFLSGEPMHPYAFVPFSAGPRNCIGQKYAMLQLKCVLSGICRNFKLSPRVPGARPELTADILLRSTEPVYVKFTRR